MCITIGTTPLPVDTIETLPPAPRLQVPHAPHQQQEGSRTKVQVHQSQHIHGCMPHVPLAAATRKEHLHTGTQQASTHGTWGGGARQPSTATNHDDGRVHCGLSCVTTARRSAARRLSSRAACTKGEAEMHRERAGWRW